MSTHLFRAVKGRNFHYSDEPISSDRDGFEVVAICGARFERWYRYLSSNRTQPTCEKCRAELRRREAATDAV